MKPSKAAKRSARAAEKLFKKGGERFDKLATAHSSSAGVKADDLANAVVGQMLDFTEAWLGFGLAFTDQPQRVFWDAMVSGGGGSILFDTIVTLDDPVQVGALMATPLISPGVTTTLNPTVTGEPVPPSPVTPVEKAKLDLSVSNQQALGLYHGFVHAGTVILFEVYVSVHS
jgi:hypothetical protein